MGVGEDRVSELSDSLLLHILSFLPTKSVVSTCILSQRWRYLYTSIPILDWLSFSSTGTAPKLDGRLETEKFMNFLDRLLLSPLHDVIMPNNIQKFRLCIDNDFDKSRVAGSISSLIIRRKVEELSLSILLTDFVFFFTCETLTMLELKRYFIRDLPESISFPSLKILRLKYIKFGDEDLIELFLSNCPVLEELILNECSWMGFEPNICISAPALKSLIITGYDNDPDDCVIKFHAPNLLSLTHTDSLFIDHVLLHSFSSLVDAYIDFRALRASYDIRSSASNLLAGLSNVKLLKVSNQSFQVVTFVDDHLPNLPTFYNLIHLEVTSMFYCSRPLLDILRVTPNLDSLVFVEGFSRFLISKDPVWAKKLVPDCLLLHLKVVEFREFYGGRRELQVIKFFLKNGRVLERMTILSSSTFPTIEKNKVMKKLVKFPRVSTSCVVDLS